MISIIPARGGSKGIPRKNIRLFCGHPLIAHTIMAAQNSKCVDRIIVSTDDDEIAEIALRYGAEVPFLRPKELATDNAKAIDNFLFTINELNKISNICIEDFVVLQPTSPLRTAKDIDAAIKLFYQEKADTVISVVKSEHPPTWYKKISNEGILVDYFTSVDNSLNRQENEETYLPNGAIYVFRYAALKENYSYYNSKTYPYIMDQKNSVDIDTLIDFELAKVLLQRNSQ